MNVWVEPLAEDALILRASDVHIIDERSAEHFAALVAKALSAELGSKRAYVLADITNVHIEPNAAKFYGPLVQRLGERFAVGVIRFGANQGQTVRSMITQSIVNKYEANVYESLDVALAVLERLRFQARERQSRGG